MSAKYRTGGQDASAGASPDVASTSNGGNRAQRRAKRRRSRTLVGASLIAFSGLASGYLQVLRAPLAYAAARCGGSDVTTGAGLDEAIQDFNSGGCDTINVTGSFTLTAAPERIDFTTAGNDLTITGGGTIDGGGVHRPIDVLIDTGDTLTISDLTLTDGLAEPIPVSYLPFPRGGALAVNRASGYDPSGVGTIIMENVNILDSEAPSYSGYSWSGGGAYLQVGSAFLTDVTFGGNYTSRDGGAAYIKAAAAGTVTLDGVRVLSNVAGDAGGGIYVDRAENLSVANSYFASNDSGVGVGVGVGGGLYTGGDNLSLVDSVFVGNQAAGDGGAVYFGGDYATLTGTSFITNYSAEHGGGIYADSPDGVYVFDSYFRGNSSGEYGGAIGSHYPGAFEITGSTFTANVAVDGGGALYSGSNLDVADSVVSGNRVTGPSGVGGGLYVGSGELTLTGSTVSSNVVDDTAGQGGAIYANGDATIANSTISGNRVAGSAGQGGGIYARASLNLEFATLSANTTGNTDDSGSTLWVVGPSLSAVATVLDDTGAVPCWLPGSGSGVTVDDTFSFASGANASAGEWCSFGGLGSDDTFVGGAFALGALADNGGLTDTMSPSSGSVLMSRGAPGALGTGVTTDQRGALRTALFTIGSVQAGASPAPGGSNAPVAAAGNASATLYAPTTTVGGTPTSWVLQAFTADDTYLIPTDDTCAIGSAAGSCTVTGLTNGQPYKFKATPSNAQGPGRASLPSNVVTPQAPNPNPPTPTPGTPPSAPRDVTAVGGDKSAVVAWSAPSSPGSFPVSTYRATASPGGQSCLVVAPALTCSVTGLANGTPYTFTVEALNGAGWSPKGGPSNAVTPGGVTPAPAPVPLPGPLTPGESVLQTNGVVDPNVTVDPNTQDNGLQIQGDGWNMDLDGLGPDGKPLNLGPDGSLRLANERDVATEGTGFLPNSEVDLYVDPPVLLTGASAGPGARVGARADGQGIYVGTVRTDAKGSFTGTATLPEDITPGDHVLQAVGYSPSAQSRAMSLGVIVEPWIVLDQGTRKAEGMHDRIRTTGSSGGIDAGVKLTPWIRYAGQGAFKQGVASITVQSDGSFRWTREIKKTKGLTAYVSYVDVESNRVFWAKVR